MQSSTYLYPNKVSGKNKRKCANVYTSWKWSKIYVDVSSENLARADNVDGAPTKKVYFETSHACLKQLNILSVTNFCIRKICVGRGWVPPNFFSGYKYSPQGVDIGRGGLLDQAVAATLNVSMVCMINNTITCCSEPLMVKHLFKLHEQVFELTNFRLVNVGCCNHFIDLSVNLDYKLCWPW